MLTPDVAQNLVSQTLARRHSQDHLEDPSGQETRRYSWIFALAIQQKILRPFFPKNVSKTNLQTQNVFES